MKLKKKETYTIIVLGLLSMIFLIYIGTTLGKRLQIDFTEENLYTLSNGSRKILQKLNSPLHMKFYYSKTAANKGTEGLRAFNNYASYVREMLEEFVSHSKNNLTLEVIDPRPDTTDEEDAMAYGLKKFHLTETERYFFGLVIKNESGTEKVIEFFDPNRQESLEYDITKLIYSVTHPKKKTIGILSSLPVLTKDLSPYVARLMRMQGKNPEESWLITKILKEFYEIKKIEKDVDQISGIDILFIIHPKDFSEKLMFAIDQFVLKGGNVLLLVDPLAISDPDAQKMMSMGQQGPSSESNLKKLMKQWGVELTERKFAGDKYLAGMGRIAPNTPTTRILPLLHCDERCSEGHKDIISSNLNKMIFVFPGQLKMLKEDKDEKKEDGLFKKITPILATTDKGNTYTAFGYEFSNPQLLWRKFQEGDERIVLGYKILGKFKSAFPDGVEITEESKGDENKSKKSKKKRKLTGIKESQKESAIIVFSDVDFINNQFSFQQTIFGIAMGNNNPVLIQNSLESLAGSKDLMSVRSKGKFNRSFDVIDKIEFEAEKDSEQKVAQINAKIASFTQELNALGRKATKENIALIQNEEIIKKKQLSKQIAKLKKELRQVKKEGREKVENIGKFFQYLNTFLIPMCLLILGIVLNYWQHRQFGLFLNRRKG